MIDAKECIISIVWWLEFRELMCALQAQSLAHGKYSVKGS